RYAGCWGRRCRSWLYQGIAAGEDFNTYEEETQRKSSKCVIFGHSWRISWAGSDAEAGAVGLGDVLIGLREVGDLHGRGVPLDGTARAHGHVAEEDGFGEPGGVLEVGAG